MERFEFTPHSLKQEKIIFSDASLTVVATGTQYGKSLAGALWMKRMIHSDRDPKGTFILMAPTYKIMQQSMLPYFTKVMAGLGTLRKTESAFYLNDGRMAYFRTETDPDSIVGIPNVKAYWLDEAGKVGLYFHENIQARAASIGGKGLYTTSPYSRNWLFKDYVKPKLQGKLPDLELIQAPSWENPFHSLHNLENRRKMLSEMDPRRFEMIFGGEFGQQAGLVYDCFNESENLIDEFRLPNGTTFYAGIDWGHTEPFVIVVRAITPDNMHYQVSEFYKPGMTIPAQMAIARQKAQIFNIKMFYCGHERPENILLFNQNGLPAIGVPEKDIQVGTDLHYELIKTRRYKIFRGSSPHTIDELETYHYPEPTDLGPDQSSRDQLPVGQYDHALSANRFITLRTYRSGLNKIPFSPEDRAGRSETQEQRFRRLMAPKR